MDLVKIEIDRFLRLVPLISLVHEFRMQNLGMSSTHEQDQVSCKGIIVVSGIFFLAFLSSMEVRQVALSRQIIVLNGDCGGEKEKLNIELQRSRTNKDVKQCQLIEHLIDVTENVVNELPGKNLKKLVVNEPAYVILGVANVLLLNFGGLRVAK
ncbi:hypothetical protein EZV62_025967 [Acer yangbiense]|uniref:Uncharacterized protein n=1 Tax=Acer yangbiense TaxID=1000413 RepID=A0A5C7H0T9_9ROSI|nr:hypothetical protein EZV62_025967 [Acer yangbiense]